ncbi:hypothetical protein PHYPSEUDO_007154 [Phytophthora pseudosyringae]|uniref:LamG-like jellyroll fold domain-containing protein n=1 Tax=Phytophthora pseudosyringae TaxID=221518 RepID=A0A8T1VGX3_9STRA|nr:hypothetical protein PHYPSEUDO_007154 [Phytophthora pseudosyringae]
MPSPLPAAAATCVCSFLSGLDALSLSHASPFWLQHAAASPCWQARLPPRAEPLPAAAYKALYLRSRSLGFTGLTSDSSDSPRSAASYQVPKVQLSSFRGCNFNFDVWFALLPEQQPDGAAIGGTIYGLQSVHAESRAWPKFHQQFVVVSATGDLFCSVVDHRPVVQSQLQVERWYHVALTYDHVTQRQDVYVDGERRRSDTGPLHREMEFLKYEQVGTGCITANALHFPRPGYLGWYGFNGVIDEFRVWGGLLTQQDVAKLSRVEENEVAQPLLWTLKSSGRPPRGARWNVREVRCSRPIEGKKLEMPTKSSRSRLAIVSPEQLPADTVEALCSFLTGFDAFNLSHANFWWMQYLSDGSIWRRSLEEATTDGDHEQPVQSWKKQYMLSRSMLFKGLHSNNDRQVDSYAYLVYAGRERRRPSHFRLNFLGSESFSFDMWFSLLPASDGRSFGGILYGLQSESCESRQWPYYHQQFVLVSSSGDLYCSVLDSRPVVANNMESNRWYHLTLTYDNGTQRQDVYLDSIKVHSSTGALHHEWGFLTHEQVGTGCISAGNLNFPHPKYLGWYGFHGVLDDFRIWSGAVHQNEVTLLAHGGKLPNERLQASVKTERTHDGLHRPLTWVSVHLTMCTRPTEGNYTQLVPFRSPEQPNCTIS